MSISTIFIWVCLTGFVGIWYGSAHSVSAILLWAGLALAIILFAACYAYAKFLLIVPLVLAVFVISVWRIQSTFVPNEFTNQLGQKIEFEGFVVADVDRRLDKQLITIQPKGHEQRLLATTSLYADFHYGDWVLVRGKITEPKQFEDFDYKKYLERHHVYGLLYYPKIIVLKHGQGNWFIQQLLVIKYGFTNQLAKVFDEPYLSLLQGLLIGARKTLSQEIVDAFIATGLSHIVAVSGYNTSIIIKTLEKSARFLGRRASIILSVSFIIGFVIISGASSSVIRASIMGGLLLVSFIAGRLYSISPSLCAAALIMVMINPRILYWDVGFQLSFAATLGIVYLFPLFEKLTGFLSDPFSLKTYLLTSLAAIIATLPLIVWQFQRMSLVAPLANVLVLPVVPITMLFGFLSSLPVIGAGFALIANYLLQYIISMTLLLSNWQHASIDFAISQFTFGLGCLMLILVTILLRWHFCVKSHQLDEPL